MSKATFVSIYASLIVFFCCNLVNPCANKSVLWLKANKHIAHYIFLFFLPSQDGLVGMAIVGGIGLGLAGLAGLVGLAVSKGGAKS